MNPSRFLFSLLIWLNLFSCGREGLTLSVGEQTAAAGGEVCLPVTAESFSDILTMQYSISWDTTVLRLVRVQDFGLPALTAENFGRPPSHPDHLTVAWFEPNLRSATIADGAVLFSLCFEVIGQSGASSAVRITDHPTMVEIANSKEEVLAPALVEGSVRVE